MCQRLQSRALQAGAVGDAVFSKVFNRLHGQKIRRLRRAGLARLLVDGQFFFACGGRAGETAVPCKLLLRTQHETGARPGFEPLARSVPARDRARGSFLFTTNRRCGRDGGDGGDGGGHDGEGGGWRWMTAAEAMAAQVTAVVATAAAGGCVTFNTVGAWGSIARTCCGCRGAWARGDRHHDKNKRKSGFEGLESQKNRACGATHGIVWG